MVWFLFCRLTGEYPWGFKQEHMIQVRHTINSEKTFQVRAKIPTIKSREPELIDVMGCSRWKLFPPKNLKIKMRALEVHML